MDKEDKNKASIFYLVVAACLIAIITGLAKYPHSANTAQDKRIEQLEKEVAALKIKHEAMVDVFKLG